MEEKPPTQAGRDVPRSRTPRTAFGTPDQPAPPSKPAERAPRRTKAAPAVTFQAAANDEMTSPDAGGDLNREPTQRRPQSGQDAKPAAKKTPAAKAAPPLKAGADPAAPAKRAAKGTPLAKAAKAAKAAQPIHKAEPAKTAPAKQAPKKVPAQAAATEPAPPRTRPARAKKATAKDAVPAQPVADATPPAKAMPTKAAPPAKVAEDPAPAQVIADATQPAKAAPVAGEPTPQPAPSREAEQRTPTTFAKLAADPGHAPELLALAAVQTIGPRAKEWAKRTREAYPKATDTALARLAADQFTRLTSPNSIVGTLAGSYAPVTLIATTALTHARVILHVAAAYGLDPTDEARAADLLVLTRVHASREDAEAALAAVKRQQKATTPIQRIGRMVTANAAGWAVVRLAGRYFPGTRLLAAALVTRSSARSMAERANTHYSQASHALGSSV
ncbi:MAG TPA: hypothetical protein VH502_11080 [Actinoplanes sp.]